MYWTCSSRLFLTTLDRHVLDMVTLELGGVVRLNAMLNRKLKSMLALLKSSGRRGFNPCCEVSGARQGSFPNRSRYNTNRRAALGVKTPTVKSVPEVTLGNTSPFAFAQGRYRHIGCSHSCRQLLDLITRMVMCLPIHYPRCLPPARGSPVSALQSQGLYAVRQDPLSECLSPHNKSRLKLKLHGVFV